LSLTEKAVKAAEASESDKTRTFSYYWNSGDHSFVPVKLQYERMLKILPDDRVQQWKDLIGIN
jgi:hypothetical protein